MTTPKVGDRVRLLGDSAVRCDVYDITLRGHGKEGRVVDVNYHPVKSFITIETDDHERWGCHYSGVGMIVLDEGDFDEEGNLT